MHRTLPVLQKWRTAVRLKSKQMSEKTNVHPDALFQGYPLWKLRTMVASTPALTHTMASVWVKNLNGSENASNVHLENHESCCSLRFLTRTRWRMSSAAPRGTLLPEKPRFYLRREQEATGGAGSLRQQPVCAVHLLPSAVTAAQEASDVQHGSRSLTLCLTALHLHVSSQSNPRLHSNRATGKQDQACPRRGAAFNCSNKVLLQNR